MLLGGGAYGGQTGLIRRYGYPEAKVNASA